MQALELAGTSAHFLCVVLSVLDMYALPKVF
jgi:hypothetical protein